MPISADTLRLQLDYSAWATQRMVAAAATLSPEELTRDFQTADKSVLGTLAHIFAADRIWLSRVLAVPRATFIDPEERDLALLQTEWPALLQRWSVWIHGLKDADVENTISFQDLRGRPQANEVWQIVLHVVNHATHHRGQVSGFLRAMVHKPPPLDLMGFYMTT